MTVLLVRHTEVALAWRGRCYGRSDMGLSRVGAARAAALAGGLAGWRPDVVVHSGLRRSAVLAVRIAGLAGVAVHEDAAWGERDFGDWEGRSWAAIYRESGDAMDGMVLAPGVFRPGGGETTDEMGDRAGRAFSGLPAGRVIVVGHGGPVAALRGRLSGVPVSEWLGLIPGYGEAVEVDLAAAGA
ncbi:phosphoglycerate mutase [Polymorphobacter glacialis]|uniref:Phosphoglycerate mutase n=1 Tax=Sandarakinorhabdus glacialis TaxID=1614636 RepID=A0A917E4Q4_9SPHN|nr:histidine phosphatase family protein [Polymorphobacter glacialis]GGE03378.1 phosphoglycerate mutase [Polymorphobacter glacialis]